MPPSRGQVKSPSFSGETVEYTGDAFACALVPRSSPWANIADAFVRAGLEASEHRPPRRGRSPRAVQVRGCVIFSYSLGMAATVAFLGKAFEVCTLAAGAATGFSERLMRSAMLLGGYVNARGRAGGKGARGLSLRCGLRGDG